MMFFFVKNEQAAKEMSKVKGLKETGVEGKPKKETPLPFSLL